MDRRTRLDLPGVLRYVIVRGVERRKLFVDDGDRCPFVERLGKCALAAGKS